MQKVLKFFKGPLSSKSRCSRLFLFWITLLSKCLIWLAECSQAVREGHHLILYSSASNGLFYKHTPNIYKITQENYRMIKREHIYTGRLKYMCRIRLSWRKMITDQEVLWKFQVHEIQICRAWSTMYFGWMWAFKN